MSEIFISNTVYDDGKWPLVPYFILQKQTDVSALTNTSNVTVRVALLDTFKL
jgi:hypothetical protein